jgi:hypothetical protein
MKHISTSGEASTATLQTVLDRIAGRPDITHSRKRDMRSAVLSFSTLADKAPASIPLDLSDFRRVLDETDGTLAKVSAKRRANLRSDLVAAIEVSGAHPMLKTGKLELHPAWKGLLDPISDPRIRGSSTSPALGLFDRICLLRHLNLEYNPAFSHGRLSCKPEALALHVVFSLHVDVAAQATLDCTVRHS